MEWARRTRRTEILVAWVVAAGVIAAGMFDFRQGSPPRGQLTIPPGTAEIVFIGACIAAAAMAALPAITAGAGRRWFRIAVLAASALPAVLADPTYASLLLAVPLIDIRRRDPEPERTIWTAGVVALVTWLLVAEDTPRVIAEVEAMFGLAIAYFIIIMFGDALRQLDQGVHVQSELAELAERSRLAGELHDSVGHHLLASSVQLQKAKALSGRDPAESSYAVELASQAVAEAMSETRLLVETTRDKSGFDMASAIQQLTTRVVPASTSATLDLSGDYSRMDPATQIALYRVVQESLSNMVRHASSTEVRIGTKVVGDRMQLEITDNGVGFEATASHSQGGVQNMRKRIEAVGGTFDITSVSGHTSVLATVPT